MPYSISQEDSSASEPPHLEGCSDRIEQHIDVTAADGTKLAGTFTRPPGAVEPVPAVLFLNGSGPLDRDSNIPGQVLDVAPAFARRLARAGIAALRFDKRGVGASAGDFTTTGLELEISDAAGCFAALRSCHGVDADRVGIIGHSVGATIAMRLAARDRLVAAVVLLAGPAVAGLAVMEWQTEQIASSLPGPDRLLPAWFRRRARQDRTTALQSERTVVGSRSGGLPAGWVQDFAVHDPSDDLRAIECPVLAITGRKDLQVDPDDVHRMGTMVSGPFTGSTPDDLTHVLRRERGRGGILSYRRQLRRPVDADLLDQVATWLAVHLAA